MTENGTISMLESYSETGKASQTKPEAVLNKIVLYFRTVTRNRIKNSKELQTTDCKNKKSGQTMVRLNESSNNLRIR